MCPNCKLLQKQIKLLEESLATKQKIIEIHERQNVTTNLKIVKHEILKRKNG